MHEVSIAESLLDIAMRECLGKGYRSIKSINVNIGRASGIMPEALHFAFDVTKIQTIAEGASLFIEVIPVGGHCNDCGVEFTVEEKFVFACPQCNGASFKVLTGRELTITEMEVE